MLRATALVLLSVPAVWAQSTCYAVEYANEALGAYALATPVTEIVLTSEPFTMRGREVGKRIERTDANPYFDVYTERDGRLELGSSFRLFTPLNATVAEVGDGFEGVLVSGLDYTPEDRPQSAETAVRLTPCGG